VQERDNAMIAVAALRQLARVCTRQGQLSEARSLYEQALALATDKEGRRLPIAGDALIGLGELQREWNHLESAARYLVEGIKLASQWRRLGALYGHISLARVRQAQGFSLGALEALQNAKQIAVRFDATDLDDQIVALQQAGLWIAQGNLSAAMSWAADRGLDGHLRLGEFCEETDAPDHHLRKYEQVMLARLWNARKRPERALTALESLLPRMEAEGRIGLVIEIQMLRALAFQAQSDLDAALMALEQALSLAEPEGYVRLFADEGEPMARLLRLAASRGITPAYAAGLLESLGEVPRRTMSPHTGPTTLIEPLTPRETDVMRYLVTGLTTPEIAREMFVATSTVRTHVKSIYGKLGVHKRWEAVQQAEMLGLL
jgi:LuxR family maltose regulon positive regulatory protein